MDKEFYVLKDDQGRYYIEEGRATTRLEDATKYTTITKLISTVPLSRDYNCEYVVYKYSGEDVEKVKESEWYPLHGEWRKNNPEESDKLYDRSTLNMLRTTYH